MNVQTLRPGFLVGMRSAVIGGVRYQRTDIERDRDGNTERVVWNTLRTIEDAREFEDAQTERNRLRYLVTSLCTRTSFGLLCPVAREEELRAAASEARDGADAWNARAKYSRIEIECVVGRVADSDRSATVAVAQELAEALEQAEQGIRNRSVQEIREAAGRAKELAAILEPEAAKEVEQAVASARRTARELAAQARKQLPAPSELWTDAEARPIAAARSRFRGLAQAAAQQDDSAADAPDAQAVPA